MKKITAVLFTVIGVLLCLFGLVGIKLMEDPIDAVQVLFYICIGLGCGLLGHGIGIGAERSIMKKDPEKKRQIEIERNDERNISVANRAKGKAYDVMLYLFGALMITYALMRADLAVILLLVVSYLIVTSVFVFYLNKYQKEM